MGANWQSVVNGFHGPTYIIAAIVVVGIAIAVWRYVRRRQAELRAEDSPTGDSTMGGGLPWPGLPLGQLESPAGHLAIARGCAIAWDVSAETRRPLPWRGRAR